MSSELFHSTIKERVDQNREELISSSMDPSATFLGGGYFFSSFLDHVAQYFTEVDDDVDLVLGGGVVLNFSELVSCYA